jgi:hypothetical protein
VNTSLHDEQPFTREARDVLRTADIEIADFHFAQKLNRRKMHLQHFLEKRKTIRKDDRSHQK